MRVWTSLLKVCRVSSAVVARCSMHTPLFRSVLICSGFVLLYTSHAFISARPSILDVVILSVAYFRPIWVWRLAGGCGSGGGKKGSSLLLSSHHYGRESRSVFCGMPGMGCVGLAGH